MNLLINIPAALTTTATQAILGEGHSHIACGVYITVCIHLIAISISY
jgi:hypothetical protein